VVVELKEVGRNEVRKLPPGPLKGGAGKNGPGELMPAGPLVNENQLISNEADDFSQMPK
jgi:hypothetical protein